MSSTNVQFKLSVSPGILIFNIIEKVSERGKRIELSWHFPDLKRHYRGTNTSCVADGLL